MPTGTKSLASDRAILLISRSIIYFWIGLPSPDGLNISEKTRKLSQLLGSNLLVCFGYENTTTYHDFFSI
jgi:hypothetical protein